MACPSGHKLSAYLDGALPARERDRIAQHLHACLPCRRELAQLQRLQLLLHDAAGPATPPDLVALTMARAKLAVRLPAPRRVPAPVWAAACAVVAVLAMSLTLQTREVRPPVRAVEVAETLTPATPLPVIAALPAPRVEPVTVAPHRFTPAPVRRVTPAPAPVAAAVAPVTPKPLAAPTVPDRVAARALSAARHHADEGDPDLTIAALENVAQAYPRAPEAAEALLTAADLQRQRGNLTEADGTYRRVLALPTQKPLPRALAHKALAELRRDGTGDDDVVRFHYNKARQALREESAQPASNAKTKALVVLADIEKTTGRRNEALADYAAAINAAPTLDVESALAEVL